MNELPKSTIMAIMKQIKIVRYSDNFYEIVDSASCHCVVDKLVTLVDYEHSKIRGDDSGALLKYNQRLRDGKVQIGQVWSGHYPNVDYEVIYVTPAYAVLQAMTVTYPDQSDCVQGHKHYGYDGVAGRYAQPFVLSIRSMINEESGWRLANGSDA